MSDNPQYGFQGAMALPDIRTLRLAGGDAAAFAQAQFMNDVAALEPGTWQWNGWLDPKGRVQALFLLLRPDADSLWLVTTADTDVLAAALRRFVFRSKVTIEPLAQHATGCLAAPERAAGAKAGFGPDVAVELDLSGEAGARTLVLSAHPAIAVGNDRPWWALDLAHGWPAVPGATLGAFTPQQLSLQRLSAFSVRKGCYPGQEIVARTHFLGRAKRGLARFRAEGLVAGGAVAAADGREVGHVVAVVGDQCLAVVPLDAEPSDLTAGGSALVPLPLAGGLAR